METPQGTRLDLAVEETERGGRSLVLRVRGEVDVDSASRLRDAVRDALRRIADEDGRALLVDLRDVTFLGASAVTALLEATRLAPGVTEPIRLVVDGNRPVVRAAEITGLEQLFSLYEDVDDALAGSPKVLEH